MHLSELQEKEIINISNGKRMGVIVDVVVTYEGKIKFLILEEKKSRRYNKESYELSWEHITKIGDDIILVNTNYVK